MPETKPEPKHPGAPGWDEALDKRKEAAELWLSKNVHIALVIPFSVARDWAPNGIDAHLIAPLVEKVMPGEKVKFVERGSDHIFVALEAS